MKNIKFLVRDYKFDLIATLSALISYVLSFIFVSSPNILLILLTLTTAFFLIILLLLRTRDKDFYFIALDKKQDRDDWIGRGQFEYSRVTRSFVVPDTDPGNIYSKCLNWSDYKFEFEFKILKNCLGAIIRAVNLSNYVMFQICQDGIRPHIRINGGWRAWEHKESGLTFNKKLSSDKWYKCIIICDKDLVNITLKHKNKTLFDRIWTIPHDRFGFPFPQMENDPKPTLIHFPSDLDYGTVGFRNANIEKALAKNVLIEKLSNGKNK